MPGGELELFQLQSGEETVWGTAVAPTVKHMGISSCSIAPIQTTERLQDIRASLQPAYMSVLTEVNATMSVEGFATYEDLDYFLGGLLGEASPTGTGPYTRAYAGPIGSQVTEYSRTFVYGDATGIYGLAGAIPTTLSLEVEKGGVLNFTCEFIGKEVKVDTFATLSDRTVNPITGEHAALYIDPFAVAAGTTAVQNTAWSASVEIDMARSVLQFLGSLSPADWKGPRFDLTCGLRLRLNATSKAYFDVQVAATPAKLERVVRLKFSDTANRDLQIDLAGVAEGVPEFPADEDGVATFEYELMGEYEATLGNSLEITTINGVSVLP